MTKRTLIVAVAVVAAFFAINLVGVTDSEGFWRGGYSRHHRGNTPISWKVVGSIVYTQLAIPSEMPPPADPIIFQPGVVIDIVAKGAPGDAQIKVVAFADGIVDDPDLDCYGYPKLSFLEADLVAIFADQSMLFATIDKEKGGFLCLEPPPQHDENHLIITGGTGRFEGAEGSFTGHFLSQPVGSSGALVAETGTIEGWIER